MTKNVDQALIDAEQHRVDAAVSRSEVTALVAAIRSRRGVDYPLQSSWSTDEC